MSKLTKNYGWLNTRPNSAKTLMERAKREIPGFKEHIRKFEEQINIKSYAPSTVFSYSRCIAQICLYCRKSPLDLDLDEINSYLFAMKTDRDMSDTFFKHTVYSLRFLFRVYDREDRAIRLPSMKNKRKLPVVFSQQELRRLFKAPQRLKQRVLLSLIYSAGLRVGEVCRLKVSDMIFTESRSMSGNRKTIKAAMWCSVRTSPRA
jgi:integrase/recombinase XerD